MKLLRGLFTFNNFVGVETSSPTQARGRWATPGKSSAVEGKNDMLGRPREDERLFWMEWKRLRNWMIIRSNSLVRSIILIDALNRLDKLPDGCYPNPITDRQSIPDCRRLCPLHEHFVVRLEQLHFLNGDVVVEQIFHFTEALSR